MLLSSSKIQRKFRSVAKRGYGEILFRCMQYTWFWFCIQSIWIQIAFRYCIPRGHYDWSLGPGLEQWTIKMSSLFCCKAISYLFNSKQERLKPEIVSANGIFAICHSGVYCWSTSALLLLPITMDALLPRFNWVQSESVIEWMEAGLELWK